jgi:hypothetical protein
MEANYISEKALGYQQLLAVAVDAGTLLTIPAGCSLVLVTPEAQACRWRDDTVAPTAAIGYPLAVGAELRYTAKQMSQLRFISQVAGCILNVTYFGNGV